MSKIKPVRAWAKVRDNGEIVVPSISESRELANYQGGFANGPIRVIIRPAPKKRARKNDTRNT